MKLHATLPMQHPGQPLDEVIRWLVQMRESGFSGDALVKLGKTTGQKLVMIINEDKSQGGLTPEPVNVPHAESPAPRMWPEG